VARAVDSAAKVVEETLAHARPDSPLRAVAISGSPRSPSKSKALAEVLLAALQKIGCETRLIDVAGLPAEALLARATAPEIEEVVAEIGRANIVAASSPTYRALYTGALKCLFDLMPQAHLAGKICLGLQTGIAPQHALSPDYGMRPLFASLEGLPALTLYATDDEFVEGRPGDGLLDKVGRIAEQAVQFARGIGPGEA
jgi:FMN reductase